jgi:hypothetical protein
MRAGSTWGLDAGYKSCVLGADKEPNLDAQENSLVLDGSVPLEERRTQWHSAHRRIVFATPQAFKNDVCKGKSPRTPSSFCHAQPQRCLHLQEMTCRPRPHQSHIHVREPVPQGAVLRCRKAACIPWWTQAMGEESGCAWRRAGLCPFERIVCLVVDECHKAVGKSDLVTVVAKLRSERCKFRLLGLSATPGATRQAVQARSQFCLCRSGIAA